LGSVALMARRGHALADGLQAAVDRLCEEGCGVACLGVDERVVGVFGFSETLRAEARAAIDALQHQGLRVAILTGDHAQRARTIADSLGVETFGALLPENKLDHLERLRREVGPVGMVGDGLNDAPALAQADVGIAVGTGTDVAMETGSVTLMRGDPVGVVHAVHLARRTMRIIRQNLFWAFLYNVIGIPVAAGVLYPAFGVLLTPAMAAGAMAISSVSVVTNSLRLRRFRGGLS
jgi:Cu+-exporting ATPase